MILSYTYRVVDSPHEDREDWFICSEEFPLLVLHPYVLLLQFTWSIRERHDG